MDFGSEIDRIVLSRKAGLHPWKLRFTWIRLWQNALYPWNPVFGWIATSSCFHTLVLPSLTSCSHSRPVLNLWYPPRMAFLWMVFRLEPVLISHLPPDGLYVSENMAQCKHAHPKSHKTLLINNLHLTLPVILCFSYSGRKAQDQSCLPGRQNRYVTFSMKLTGACG